MGFRTGRKNINLGGSIELDNPTDSGGPDVPQALEPLRTQFNQEQSNRHSTFAVSSSGPISEPAQDWEYTLVNGGVVSPTLIADSSQLYIEGAGGIEAVDKETGSGQWVSNTISGSSMGVDSTGVYVEDLGTVYKLDPDTGQQIWSTGSSSVSSSLSGLTVSPDNLYSEGVNETALTIINKSTGNVETVIESTPPNEFGGIEVVLVDENRDTVFFLDSGVLGERLWSFNKDGSYNWGPVEGEVDNNVSNIAESISYDGRFIDFFSSPSTDTVYKRIDSLDGSEVISKTLESPPSSVKDYTGVSEVASVTGNVCMTKVDTSVGSVDLIAVNRNTGDVEWELGSFGELLKVGMNDGNRIYSIDASNGNLLAVDIEDGSVVYQFGSADVNNVTGPVYTDEVFGYSDSLIRKFSV